MLDTKTEIHSRLKEMLKELELTYKLSSMSLSTEQVDDLNQEFINIFNEL